MATQTSAAELLAHAVEAAQSAGELLMARFRGQIGTVASKSSPTDLVSDVDRASEALIVEMLRARRPADSILGEEGGAREGSSGVRWIIDPLDGTINYLYGIPVFAVSIAAEVGNQVVAGAVVDPTRDEVFIATRGGGASCNGKPLEVSKTRHLSLALVGTGFSYDSAERRGQGHVLQHVIGLVRDIRRAGSAALDLCSVAAGRLDAYFESGVHEWDRAAGALIAAEAGAWVGGLSGPPTDDMTIAGPEDLALELRAVLSRSKKA
jgi:myo-inositol-1(or 4)-monophosphatase